MAVLRGLINQLPPALPPSVASMGPLPPSSALLPAPLPAALSRPTLRPGILGTVKNMLNDPANQRALLAFGMNLLGGGNFAQAYAAGAEANDRYNQGIAARQKMLLDEQRAQREDERQERMLGFEERKVSVAERREQIEAQRAEALARYQEMMGKAALENALTGRMRAQDEAEYRRALIAQGYSRIAADREIAQIRAAASDRANQSALMRTIIGEVGRSQRGGRAGAPNLTPAQRAGILAQVLSPRELEALKDDPMAYAAALDAVAQGYASGGMQGAAAGARQRAPLVSSDAQYNALPSGALFVTPDGRLMRKP